MNSRVYNQINKHLQKDIGNNFDDVVDIINNRVENVYISEALSASLFTLQKLCNDLQNPWASFLFCDDESLDNGRHINQQLLGKVQAFKEAYNVHPTDLILVIATKAEHHEVGKAHFYDDFMTDFSLHKITSKFIYKSILKYFTINANDIENNLKKKLKSLQKNVKDTTHEQIQISSAYLVWKSAVSDNTLFLKNLINLKDYDVSRYYIHLLAQKTHYKLNQVKKDIKDSIATYNTVHQKQNHHLNHLLKLMKLSHNKLKHIHIT